MRVAFVVPQLHLPDGWRAMSLGVIQAMQSANITPLLFVSQKNMTTAKSLFPQAELLVLPHIQSMSYRTLQAVPMLLNRWWQVSRLDFPSVDLVHSLAGYPTGLVGHWLASRLRVPHIISIAGSYGVMPYMSRLHRLMYGRVLQQAAYICPISNGTAEMVKRYFRPALADTPMKAVLLGTDYTQKVSAQVASNRSLPAVPTILSVGGLKPRKGYHVSLQAFAKLKKRLPEAHYTIIGGMASAAYQKMLQQLIAQHAISDVSFLVAVSEEELASHYRKASLFLLTPQQIGLTFEGFGLVYLEAGAYGLPVIGTKTGGVAEAVRDGETGFLAAPDDIDALADALYQLLTDHDLNKRMGWANRTWAETLTWPCYAEQQYEIYQKAISRSRI